MLRRICLHVVFAGAVAAAFLGACSSSTTSRRTTEADAGTDASNLNGGSSSSGGKTNAGGAGGTTNTGGVGANGAGGTTNPNDSGAGGSSSGGITNTGGTRAADSGAGGVTGATGGTTNAAGGSRDASVTEDSGPDASTLECAVDGTSCAGAADGSAVCCGGQCVAGDCCEPTDCGRAGDGGAGYLCSNHQCLNVAGTLTGLEWLLPCTSPNSSVACNTNPTTTVSQTLGGAPGVTYDVTLRFRGIVEQKTYSGGCGDGSYWQIGGADNGDSYNVYELDVSSPKQTFFLNRGASGITNAFALDYQETVHINAGATVTLFAASKDNQEIINRDTGGAPLVIDGVPSITQPYDGQFIHMDVLSVVPSATPAGTSSYALRFDGGQVATIADAASLEPSSLTLESWFQFATPSGSYNSIVGKPYQGGSVDSFVLWYQSNVLQGAVGLGGPSGASAVAWTPVSGDWHHAALTYDAATQAQTLYIDGLVTACGQLPNPAYDTHAVLIGGDVDNGSPNGFWNGALDEVRVFSTARTAAQVWSDMHRHSLGATPGLVGEWTFDEGAGQTAADSSGNGNNAVLGSTNAAESNDPVWVQSTAPY